MHKLLGVVPNCDRYLEVWPPAFRAYNVMVPNLLNLPVPILGVGGPPPGVVGLAMYVGSRNAGCTDSRAGWRPSNRSVMVTASVRLEPSA